MKVNINIKHKFFIIFFMALMFCYSLLLSDSGIPSLMIDSYGARAMALGDAFVGIADDINTISVNPAGLNMLDSIEGSFTYLRYLLDMNFGYLVVGAPLSKSIYSGYLAGSLTLFHLSEFDQYDEFGNMVGEKLSASDFAFTLGYGNNPLKLFGIKQNFNVGINLKYIQSRLVEESKSAFGIDIGVLYKINFINWGLNKLQNNLGIGFSIQNLGTSIKYKKENTPLPRNLKIGIGYNFYKNKNHGLLTGFDVNIPDNGITIISMGIEYTYFEMLSLRIGYKPAGRDLESVSLGIGGRYMLSSIKIGLDYSIIPLQNLGMKHIFSLNLQFGKHRKYERNFSLDDEENELLIKLTEYEDKLFNKEKSTIKETAYEIFDDMVNVIKKEDYKRVILTIHIFAREEYKLKLLEKQWKTVYNYFIKKGIDKKRLEHKIYEKVLIAGEKEKTRKGEFKILIIRWKKGEEEQFKEHYFNGMDAFIKEGYNIAIEEWEKVLIIDPDNEDVKSRLIKAKKALKLKNEKFEKLK